MAPQPNPNLAKIGKEAFDIIDKYYCKDGSTLHNPPKEPTWVHEQQEVCHQRYQPQDSYTCYQPLEAQTARVIKGYYQPQPPQESYTCYQPQEAHTARATKAYFPPQEAHTAQVTKYYNSPKEARTAEVTLAYGTEATSTSSYHYYETASQSLENMVFMEYQRPTIFRMTGHN